MFKKKIDRPPWLPMMNARALIWNAVLLIIYTGILYQVWSIAGRRGGGDCPVLFSANVVFQFGCPGGLWRLRPSQPAQVGQPINSIQFRLSQIENQKWRPFFFLSLFSYHNPWPTSYLTTVIRRRHRLCIVLLARPCQTRWTTLLWTIYRLMTMTTPTTFTQ